MRINSCKTKARRAFGMNWNYTAHTMLGQKVLEETYEKEPEHEEKGVRLARLAQRLFRTGKAAA